MRLFILLCLLVAPVILSAQNLSRGLLVGGVGHDSARVYLRTDLPTAFVLEYGTDSLFATFKTVLDSTRSVRDNSVVVSLKNLAPDTYYFLRLKIGGNIAAPFNRFRTFPLPGQTAKEGVIRLAFGSCIQRGGRKDPVTGELSGPTPEDSIFLPIVKRNPQLFLNLGDWAYPNTDIANADTIIAYTREMSIIEEAYRVRYSADSFPCQAKLMRNVPFDYIWDDCDYVDGGSGGLSVASKQGNPDPPITLQFDPINRANVLEAYQRYFPHYGLTDTPNGIYHKFALGNIDVFVLDLRANMAPFYDSFVYGDSGKFVYKEPANHSILGETQKQWLKNQLSASTADWKVIVSSFTFHQGYDELLDIAIELQGVNLGSLNGTDLAYKLVEGWPGFRVERKEIIDYVRDNKINGVVVISGDSHTSAIDDGQNGGLPELMSANLTVENGGFLEFFPDLWDRCAQKVNGVPDSETFGLLEAYGADSMRMVLVDQFNNELCSHLLHPNDLLSIDQPKNKSFKVYPNPTTETLTVEWAQADANLPCQIKVWDNMGRLLTEKSLHARQFPYQLDLREYPRGLVVVTAEQGQNSISKIVALR